MKSRKDVPFRGYKTLILDLYLSPQTVKFLPKISKMGLSFFSPENA